MPKTKNPDLHYQSESGKDYFLSQKEASRNYETNKIDKFALRMPKGMREVINAYVEKKAMNDDPDDRHYTTDKGRPSVNAYINYLIEKDMSENPIE